MCAAELASFIPVGLDVLLKIIEMWIRSEIQNLGVFWKVQLDLPDSQSKVCPEN